MTTRQQLLWMPRTEKSGVGSGGTGMVPFEGERPTRVWTLFRHREESEVPSLPYVPTHTHTAFLEDHVHDWMIQRDFFRYYSRVIDLKEKGVWLLLEWEEKRPRR